MLGAATLACGLAASRSSRAADTLMTRPIPHSGEKLPAVGLGTAIGFDAGDGAKHAELRSVIEALAKGGGTLIDTASSYGDAEKVIGELLAETKLRRRIFLATKLESRDARAGKDEFRRSLKLLGTDKADLIQLHNIKSPNESLAMMRDWKAEGLCRYIGITTSFNGDFGAMEAVLRREKPDFMQVNYSLSDREAEQRLLPAASDVGAAVLTDLPFGRGNLFRATRGKEVPSWGLDFDASSWGQFFLKYLLGNETVTAVIPGTTNPAHMADNLGAGIGRLPDKAQREKMVAFWQSIN
jgi:aryl-alcohol dehydrogenase-like predicted oxidoreductase